MSILDYFRQLPNPGGSLSRFVPPNAIQKENKEVRKVIGSPAIKKINHNSFSHKQKAEMRQTRLQTWCYGSS